MKLYNNTGKKLAKNETVATLYGNRACGINPNFPWYAVATGKEILAMVEFLSQFENGVHCSMNTMKEYAARPHAKLHMEFSIWKHAYTIDNERSRYI